MRHLRAVQHTGACRASYTQAATRQCAAWAIALGGEAVGQLPLELRDTRRADPQQAGEFGLAAGTLGMGEPAKDPPNLSAFVHSINRRFIRKLDEQHRGWRSCSRQSQEGKP